jgi:hypothetical protein
MASLFACAFFFIGQRALNCWNGVNSSLSGTERRRDKVITDDHFLCAQKGVVAFAMKKAGWSVHLGSEGMCHGSPIPRQEAVTSWRAKPIMTEENSGNSLGWLMASKVS